MTITTPLWQKKSTLIILWVWVAGVEQASTTVLSKNCSVMSTAFLIMLVTDERTGWRCHVQAGTGPLMQQLAQATWKGICVLGGQVDGIIFVWWGMVSWAVGRCRMLDRYWIGHGSFNRFSWREKKKINVMFKLLLQAKKKFISVLCKPCWNVFLPLQWCFSTLQFKQLQVFPTWAGQPRSEGSSTEGGTEIITIILIGHAHCLNLCTLPKLSSLIYYSTTYTLAVLLYFSPFFFWNMNIEHFLLALETSLHGCWLPEHLHALMFFSYYSTNA